MSNAVSQIGQLLISKGYIDLIQLTMALEFQAKLNQSNYMQLGEILITLNFITREQLEEILKKQSNLRNIEVKPAIPPPPPPPPPDFTKTNPGYTKETFPLSERIPPPPPPPPKPDAPVAPPPPPPPKEDSKKIFPEIPLPPPPNFWCEGLV